MDVDEAGGEDEAFSIDYGFAGLRFQGRRDFGDAVGFDADVGFAERFAGAVGELGVDDEGGGVPGRECVIATRCDSRIRKCGDFAESNRVIASPVCIWARSLRMGSVSQEWECSVGVELHRSCMA